MNHFKGFSSGCPGLHAKFNADVLPNFAIHYRQNKTSWNNTRLKAVRDVIAYGRVTLASLLIFCDRGSYNSNTPGTLWYTLVCIPSNLLILRQISCGNAVKGASHNKLFQYIAGSGRLQHGDSADGPHWTCTQCTFQNHPLLDKCETCEMPRLLLGTDTCYCHPIPSKTCPLNPVVMHVEKLPPAESACELWSD
jgi:hypothetical protein